MRLSNLASAIALSLATSLGAFGCGPPVLGPVTNIGQGESFACGNPKFDSFFEEVLDARSKTSDLDGETPLKKRLADGLGLAPTAASDQMFSAAKERAEAIKSGGGAIYVQLFPEPRSFSRDGKEKAGALGKTLEETTKLGLDKADELAGLAAQIRQTEAKLDDLKQEADSAFPDAHKRAEVMRELEASQIELEKARNRALAESGRSLNFVAALARAADTGGADLVASSESGGKGKPAGKGSGASKPSGPTKPAGMTGPAKPAGGGAKPKHKEDFDP